MSTIRKKLYPVGTHVFMSHGHGYGRIVGYNGQKRVDIDQQLRWLSDSNVPAGFPAVCLMGGLAAGMYSGDRYPYVVKWDPSEKWPDGYQDVYGPEGLHFSVTGERGNKDAWTEMRMDGSQTNLAVYNELVEISDRYGEEEAPGLPCL